MARRARRKGARRWKAWALLAIALLVAAAAGWYWWQSRHWRPSEARFPEQGLLVGEDDGEVRFDIARGLGARFAYLEASRGGRGQDLRFDENLAAAREAGLAVGAVHVFDPCASADAQSANFVVAVPRDRKLLPPVVLLDGDADFCPRPVGEAGVQSELMTLVNQIEAHSGRPVILAPSAAFEKRYRVGGRIERNLWLTRNLREPRYAGRPWTLWTANETLVTDAAPTPLRWVVAQP